MEDVVNKLLETAANVDNLKCVGIFKEGCGFPDDVTLLKIVLDREGGSVNEKPCH